MARVLILLIRAYRRVLSPLKPGCCRFHPTCSRYAIEALRLHGSLKGTLLALWRIGRCHPLSAWGHDPVPPRGRWRHPERELHRQ